MRKPSTLRTSPFNTFPSVRIFCSRNLICVHLHKKLNEKRNGENGYCATFAGQNVNFDGQNFTGADLTAVFGGVKCDLRNAIIDSDVVINASSTFGGIEIFVPSDVKIKIKSTPIFGGVENKANTKPTENSHTIYINSTAVFGGVEIK